MLPRVLCEAFPILLALEQFLSRVAPVVPVQIQAQAEGLSTLLAMVQLLPSANPLVFGEDLALPEAHLALSALVLFAGTGAKPCLWCLPLPHKE